MSSALTAQPALRARRPRRARHLREQGPKRCQRAGTGLGNGRGRRASICASQRALRGQASVARAINFLQAPDLAYTPKIEILHSWNRNAPFASSDTTRRADHYGALRSRPFERVVAPFEVKVWSAVAARHGVGASERKCSSMGSAGTHDLFAGDPTSRPTSRKKVMGLWPEQIC